MPSNSFPGLTVVGLGPGPWEALTVEAAALLQRAADVYLRVTDHVHLDALRAHCPDTAFHVIEPPAGAGSAPTDVIVSAIAARLTAGSGVFYGVPGSPLVGEPTVPPLLAHCAAQGIESRVVDGISRWQSTLAAVGCFDASWLQLLDAREAALLGTENAVGETPGADAVVPWRAPLPVAPLLITQLDDLAQLSPVRCWLRRYYPPHHTVQLVHALGRLESLPLDQLDRISAINDPITLYVPPLPEMENTRTFTGIMQLTRRLRGPGGCPWDREQTQQSLKPYLLEETYEALDALDSGDPALIAEEFGDLLYQITIHAQVAAEHGAYTIEDVIESVMTKLIGRHPHVFGDVHLSSAQDVRHAWESFKQRQKPQRSSILEGIPRGLPALPQSNLMQKRAASVGFVWPGIDEVIAKIEEEIDEFRREVAAGASAERQRDELGDLLFALVGIARQQRIDPEEALRLANHKFAERFRFVERQVAVTGRSIRDLSGEELDALWMQAKVTTGAGLGERSTPNPA